MESALEFLEKNISRFSGTTVLIPCDIGHRHWTTLALFFEDQSFRYRFIDSYQNEKVMNKYIANIVASKLKSMKHYIPEGDIATKRRQNTLKNCGIYCIDDCKVLLSSGIQAKLRRLTDNELSLYRQANDNMMNIEISKLSQEKKISLL